MSALTKALRDVPLRTSRRGEASRKDLLATAPGDLSLFSSFVLASCPFVDLVLVGNVVGDTRLHV